MIFVHQHQHQQGVSTAHERKRSLREEVSKFEGEEVSSFWACFRRRECHGTAFGRGLQMPINHVKSPLWRQDISPLFIHLYPIRPSRQHTSLPPDPPMSMRTPKIVQSGWWKEACAGTAIPTQREKSGHHAKDGNYFIETMGRRRFESAFL